MDYSRLKKMPDRFFLMCENIIYFTIGLALVATAIFLIIHVGSSFFTAPPKDKFVTWVVEILDNTLLTLMIIEILYTIRVSIKEHALTPEPFLIVAVIAAVRRILVVSVELAHMPEKFDRSMIEIGVLGVLIFIFVMSIIIFNRMMPCRRP